MEKSDSFWDVEHAEILNYDNPEEALEMYLDSCYKQLPKKIDIIEYKPIIMTETSNKLADSILEIIWDETLEEKYGNFEYPSTPPKEVIDAAVKFSKVLLDNYKPWQCEPTGKRVEYDCEEWVKVNCPHWITEDGVKFS